MFLTIVIPVYNTKISFLEECLDSLKHIDSERYKFETIIVDDGSKDTKTLEYLKSKESEYKIIYKENGGVGSARNKGVENAISDYIFYLDSDDKLANTFNLFLKKLKENPSIDVLYGNLKTFDADIYEVIYPDFNRLTLYFDENVIPNGSFFKKKAWKAIDGNDEILKILEDYDFWIRIALKGFNIVHLNSTAYLYRKIQNGESLIQRTASIIDKYEEIMKAKNPLSKKEFDEAFIDAFKKTKKSHVFKLRSHYYSKKNKSLKPELFHFFKKTYAQKFYDLAYVSEKDIDLYLHKKLVKKPRVLNGLTLYLYTPYLYKFLTKCGAFSYRDNFL